MALFTYYKRRSTTTCIIKMYIIKPSHTICSYMKKTDKTGCNAKDISEQISTILQDNPTVSMLLLCFQEIDNLQVAFTPQ